MRTGQRFAPAPVPHSFLVLQKVAASVQVVVSFDAARMHRSSIMHITLVLVQVSPAACHISRYLNAADCSRFARVQHDSPRRATAVEGGKLARVKSEDVLDWLARCRASDDASARRTQFTWSCRRIRRWFATPHRQPHTRCRRQFFFYFLRLMHHIFFREGQDAESHLFVDAWYQDFSEASGTYMYPAGIITHGIPGTLVSTLDLYCRPPLEGREPWKHVPWRTRSAR